MVHLFMIAGYHADFEDDSKERVVLLQASRMARSSVWCQAQSGEGCERESEQERCICGQTSIPELASKQLQ